MGPSMSIDGVSPADAHRRARARGFNGAVDEHRRSRGRSGPGCRWTSCFNGAVDEHRRSRARRGRHGRAHGRASMGPSMSIDGVQLLCRVRGPARVRASMGPSMSIDGVTTPIGG